MWPCIACKQRFESPRHRRPASRRASCPMQKVQKCSDAWGRSPGRLDRGRPDRWRLLLAAIGKLLPLRHTSGRPMAVPGCSTRPSALGPRWSYCGRRQGRACRARNLRCPAARCSRSGPVRPVRRPACLTGNAPRRETPSSSASTAGAAAAPPVDRPASAAECRRHHEHPKDCPLRIAHTHVISSASRAVAVMLAPVAETSQRLHLAETFADKSLPPRSPSLRLCDRILHA